MTSHVRLWARLALILAVLLVTLQPSAPLWAQETLRQVDESGALLPRQGPGLVSGPQTGAPAASAGLTADPADEAGTLDYAAWDRLAQRAETAAANRNSESQTLEALRAQIVDWRGALLSAQSANAARIATLRAQIAALGPAPAEGVTEAAEIAARRLALAEQLVTLQAPGLAADEGYRRAGGLIAEIDRILRERQADQLLKLLPAPINPTNWPEAIIGLTDTGIRLWDETAEKWTTPKSRDAFGDNLPFILVLLALAVGLSVYGRAWVQSVEARLQARATVRGRKIMSLFASLGEVAFPLVGVFCAFLAIELAGMMGEVGAAVVEAMANLAVYVIFAAWLAGRVFPHGLPEGPLGLPPERRAEARRSAVAMASLLGLAGVQFAAMDAQAYSDGTTSVVSFPGIVISGLLLVRMGQILSRQLVGEVPEGETVSYGKRLIGFLGQGTMLVGVIGPVLAGVGYVPAAAAMVYPAMLTLFTVGILLVLQDLVTDVYAAVTRSDAEVVEALFPVLANFALALASLPVFALIWGARSSDLTELWTRFREGFSLGETRISPTNFLIFAVVFGLGYLFTRMFQEGLRNSILPRTSLDQGGQNALVSGTGYIGIFLAALAAINAAGIDLSGLAIVAGALSVGIGFGLQTVVSNFVSGIILLVERPVSEGDWIQVGEVQGTVRSISVRSTRIQTFDRSEVIVPNSDLISGQVTNFTRFNLSGRLIVPVGVAFGTDTRKVERVLREIAEAQPLAVLNPPPSIFLMGFGADAINFEIRVILRDVNFSNAVRSDINHQIVERFAAENIEIPFAQTEVYLRNADALGQALRGLPALDAAPVSKDQRSASSKVRSDDTAPSANPPPKNPGSP